MARALVESSLLLPVTAFASRLGQHRRRLEGTLRWAAWATDDTLAELEYQLNPEEGSSWTCILLFALLDGAAPLPVQQRIALTRTRPNFGGFRWWFLCPGDGQSCGRRSHKLYLPAGGGGFACRHCHGLVYSSTLR